MKKSLPAVVLIVIAFIWNYYVQPSGSSFETNNGASSTAEYHEWQSGEQVRGDGVVARVLPDDNNGSRHQRFILSLGEDRTILIAHNIDLAPRISSLRKGDTVMFSGVFEWNDRGGLVHWTHHDPLQQHAPGWLRHNGRLYE